MGFEDENHCFMLTSLKDFYKKPPRICCIIDLNQEVNLLEAIDNAYNMVYKEGLAKNIPPADIGSEFTVNTFRGDIEEEDKQYQKYQIQLASNGLINVVTKKVIFKYFEIEDMKTVKCGLEFRNIDVPTEL